MRELSEAINLLDVWVPSRSRRNILNRQISLEQHIHPVLKHSETLCTLLNDAEFWKNQCYFIRRLQFLSSFSTEMSILLILTETIGTLSWLSLM